MDETVVAENIQSVKHIHLHMCIHTLTRTPVQVRAGGTDRSYGVEVARLAGLPACVVERADALSQGEYSSHLQY